MNIHTNLKERLDKFIEKHSTPHIIFHGPSGSGKISMLYYLLQKIYHNIENKEKYLMYINCAHGKGIKFIREELKFFAKTNIQKKEYLFKSIILFNADKLTIDAQSALRRCIEEFSHTTRFFIVVENFDRLLKPIISRFCNIFVPLPIIDDKKQTLYDYNMKLLNNSDTEGEKRKKWLQKHFDNIIKKNNTNLMKMVSNLYKRAYSGIDLMNTIETSRLIDEKKKYHLLMHLDSIRKEFRSEKLFILYILTLIFASD